MEFRGTKGKWKQNKHSVFIGEEEKIGVNVICRLHLGAVNYMNDEQKYNALLISKAPEMLEMLKYFTDFPDDDFKEFNYKDVFEMTVMVHKIAEAKKLIKEATEI